MNVFSWYFDMPVVSRSFLTAAVLATTACFFDIVSPLSLYYNYDLIVYKGQYWRFLSSFVFFGTFSVDFVFHLFFVTHYCRLLEDGHFRGRTTDFVFLLLCGAVVMLFTAVSFDIFSKIKFLGHPFAFMMVYIWGKDPENANVRMSLLGLFPFNAPYLPWVLLSFSLIMGNPVETDLLGIVVGHIFYFLEFVYPNVAFVRRWSVKRVMVTPGFLKALCTMGGINNGVVVREVVPDRHEGQGMFM